MALTNCHDGGYKHDKVGKRIKYTLDLKKHQKQDCMLQCQAQLEENGVFLFHFPINKPKMA